jgi:hypothetical protein
MTSKETVLAKFPEADHLSRRMMGTTFYVIVESWNRRMVLGEATGSASKAWTNARKRIEAGAQPYPLTR